MEVIQIGGIFQCFSKATDSSLHRPDSRQIPAVGAVQGDCERVSGCAHMEEVAPTTCAKLQDLDLTDTIQATILDVKQ